MNNTEQMIKLFGGKYLPCKPQQPAESQESYEARLAEYNDLLHHSQILDVILACFPDEGGVYWQEIRNYYFTVAETTAQLNAAWIRMDGDAYAYENYAKSMDNRRTNAHNSALNGGSEINKLSEQLHIDSVFEAELSREAGKRAVAGDEFCRLVKFRNNMREEESK